MRFGRERAILWNDPQGRKGCICKDGIEPRCKETGDTLVCPDGSKYDKNIGSEARPYLEGCKNEKWAF